MADIEGLRQEAERLGRQADTLGELIDNVINVHEKFALDPSPLEALVLVLASIMRIRVLGGMVESLTTAANQLEQGATPNGNETQTDEEYHDEKDRRLRRGAYERPSDGEPQSTHDDDDSSPSE